MALAALIALTLLASGPAAEAPMATAPVADVPAADAPAQKTPEQTASDQAAADDGIPPGAPKDDYRFVAWCYGAMDESILVYQSIIPDLKAIDARIGSPIKEDVPYAKDVAEERLALKRFASAMEAAERASPRPIAPQGAQAIQLGRAMWSQAKMEPSRQLAHAWLMWGSPERCETTAKTLKARATLLGQAMAIGAPTVDAAPPAAPVTPPAESPQTPAPGPNTAAATTPAATPTIDSVLDGAAPPQGQTAPPAP
jgi:hypothetical protein